MLRTTLIFSIAAAIFIIFIVPGSEARMTITQLRGAMKGMGKTCSGKTGVAPELVAQTKDGVFAEDRALQCYYLCLLNQLKVIKDGKLAIDAMFKQVDMMMPADQIDRFKAAMQACFDAITKEDSCEMSLEYMKCYWEADKDIYFFPGGY